MTQCRFFLLRLASLLTMLGLHFCLPRPVYLFVLVSGTFAHYAGQILHHARNRSFRRESLYLLIFGLLVGLLLGTWEPIPIALYFGFHFVLSDEFGPQNLISFRTESEARRVTFSRLLFTAFAFLMASSGRLPFFYPDSIGFVLLVASFAWFSLQLMRLSPERSTGFVWMLSYELLLLVSVLLLPKGKSFNDMIFYHGLFWFFYPLFSKGGFARKLNHAWLNVAVWIGFALLIANHRSGDMIFWMDQIRFFAYVHVTVGFAFWIGPRQFRQKTLLSERRPSLELSQKVSNTF